MDANLFLQNHGVVTVANPEYNPKSKKNKVPRTIDIVDLNADRNQLQEIVAQDLLNQDRVSTKEARKYEKYGINWNPTEAANGSLDVQLAEAQSNWAKLGNALAQTVVSEIGLGTVLGVSDLFDAIGQAIGVSDHDYNNPVSAKLAEWQDKFNNEVAPIYSRPGTGFGNGTDFGWWMQNIPSIASSLTLLLPAAGGTKLLSMAGKVALKTTKAGAKWLEKAARLDRIHKAGHSVGISSRAYETGKLFAKNATTAALSRTMENYQEARQVYNDMYVDVLDSLNTMSDEEYNNFLNRNQNTVAGVDTSNKDEVAKAVARQSSDLTFKTDYANTVFDIIELYALRNVAFHGFRNSKVSAAARRLDINSRRFAGKYSTLQELEELVSKQSLGRKAADKLGDIFYAGRTVGLAQASEGIEEAVNYIAQQEGMEVGKSMLSMEANTTFSNRLKQYRNNPELWESAFWGVAGGIVFQGAGSGLARAKTALERKNEKKKNKPNEKTGEDVNASTKWKELWELPDVKRVKASIENRLALENYYQSVVKQVLDNNELSAEEKEIYLQALREQRRTELALNAMDSGTIDMLKGYLEDDNVKQALIDKGIVTKEQADDIQREDIEAIQKVQDKYDDNVRRLNAISRNIYAKNGTHIPTEYLQIIARNNIAAQLTVENYQRQLASWSEDATNLQHDLEENDKIDKNINYKEAIRLRWLSEKLGYLEADKKAILDNKKIAKSISGKEKIRELDANIAIVKKQVAELNPENTIENLLFAIQTSLGYEKFNGEYLETGRRKEYADFTRALLSKDTKYFEKLDDKLVGIEERHFGAKDVLSQNMSRALAKSETNISNISKELGEAYATLASLQYMIDAERTNIKLNDEEVEKEAGYIHNYMNEVRKQKIEDSKQTLKKLADTYGSENIRNLVTQRYNGQQLDYSSINMTEEDKNRLNEVLDTLNLSEKLNSDVAIEVDVILATHDNVKAAQDADERSRVIENSFTSENEDLGTQNQNRDNPSTEAQQPEIGQDTAQYEANRVQTNPQQNPSGLALTDRKTGFYIHDGARAEITSEYVYKATSNPNQFRVEFTISPKNVKHFNNQNLFVQEVGVDLTNDNYIIARDPIIDTQGNVIEKGVLALATPDNATQAEANAIDDEQQRQQQIASKGEVVRPQLSPEQVAGVQEEKPAEDTSKAAEIPYDANDVRSLANADMISEVSNAIKDKKDVDWDDFRKRLNDKYQPGGNTSQAITEDIESVIRAGKKLAERKGVKSVDAVADVIAKSSRLRENTSNEDAKKEFSDSVQNLLDVFNSEVGIDIVNGKRYINIEALCRYCDKVLNDKLSAGLLLNNLLDLTKDTKKYCVTDVNTDKIKDKLRSDVNSFDLSNGHLGIDYLSMLRQAEISRDETARAAFYEVIDNIQPGDKIDVERDDNNNGGLVFRVNGVKIGLLPYPHVSNNRTLYQANDDWNTDILFIQGGNIQSKLKDLFITWNNNLDNPDIRELNDIILQYMDPKYDGNKSELVKKFAKNKEVQKAIAQKYTVDNLNYETLLKGITKIWRYTRTFGDFYEGDVVTSRAKAITRWFTDRVAPSFNFIQRVKENPNIEVEVETITEGELIIERDESKRLPVSKAIGTNYKGKIRLGIAQEPTYITIGGKGINGSTSLRYSKAGIGNTFVVIPARNGDHQVVRAYRQKVSSDNISKTAKDIKNAIYSEIRRICSDDKSFQEDKLKTLEAFLRKVLPVYTTGTTKPNATASFFDADSLAETNLTIGDNVKNARGYTVSYRQSKDSPNIYLDVWNNGTTHRTENGVRTDIDINTFAEEIIKGIETCGTFNLSFAAINSDLGYAERQYLTRRDGDGKYIISIPNHEPFVFNSYSDFILDNDLVTLTTRPTPDGKSNFNRLSDRYYANQQLYVKIVNETTSPVEESTTTPTVANPRETEILDILNSKRIKNKAEKLADLLFGKKVRKSLSFGKKEYKLFPKNIIFVDKNIEDNALVNTSDRPLLHEDTQILMPAKTVVLGKEWLEMATSDNIEERKQAAKKLIHEQLHILLSGENSKYVEQIREVFDEFAEKNTNEELNKYLYKWDEARYYTDGKLNQDGLEEFLVETLTSNELANALNNIETTSTEDKTKKESLFQKIMKLLARILGIDIKQGSLYEKEFKLLRDVLDTNNGQLELQFDKTNKETVEQEVANANINFDKNSIEIETKRKQITKNKIEEIIDNNSSVRFKTEGGYKGLAERGNLTGTVFDGLSPEEFEQKAKIIEERAISKLVDLIDNRHFSIEDAIDFLEDEELLVFGFRNIVITTALIQEFEEQQNPIIELNTNELLNVLDSNVSDVLSDDDMDIFGSRIREETSTNYTPEMETIKAKTIANGTFMKAPNGNSTNLTERQWLQVRTKAFKEWFGDWYNKGITVKLAEGTVDDPNFLILKDGKPIGSFTISGIGKIRTQLNPGEKIGYISGNINNTGVEIDAELRGKGFGIASYIAMNRYLNQQGEVLKSEIFGKEDIGISAKRVWDSLVKKGLAKETTDGYEMLQDKSVSKVVDENGEPLVVYHGTPSFGFNIFDLNTKSIKDRTEQGVTKQIYFAKDREVAEEFAISNDVINALQLYLADNADADIFYFSYKLGLEPNVARKLLDAYYEGNFDKDIKDYGEKVYEVFLNIKDPIIIDAKEKAVYQIEEKDRNKIGTTDGTIIKNVFESLRLDVLEELPNGERHLRKPRTTDYLVSNSNQIKSATDNVGTFSKTDDNIKHSRLRENTSPSIPSYVSMFPLSEQPEIINKIDNGKISTSCK